MAVNVKRTAIAAAVLAVAIVFMLAVNAGLVYLMTGGTRSEISTLKNKITALEKRISAGAASGAAPSTTTQTNAVNANSAVYEGWATYKDKTSGFVIRYPETWTAEASSSEQDSKPVEYVVVTSPDQKYYVAIGLRKKGSQMLLMGRTGTGTGDMKAAGTITVMGVKVKRTEQVYKGEVKGYFYPEVGKVFEAAGYQGYAEIGKTGAVTTEKYNLKGIEQTLTAEKIISSLSITP